MKRLLALVLAAAAAVAFVGAFVTPFVHSDFDPELPAPLMDSVDAVQRGTNWLENTARGLLGDDVGNGVGEWTRGVTGSLVDGSLDAVLGPAGETASGAPVTWAECMAESDWSTCVKGWMAYKAGIPVGDQYILGVIAGLFSSGEVILALLLFTFSVLFPVSKVALSAYLGVVGPNRRPGWFRALELTSKWSMTDVFVVALLITFFKADSFNFHFEAKLGVYLFAAGAIASSLAVHLLKQVEPASRGSAAAVA